MKIIQYTVFLVVGLLAGCASAPHQPKSSTTLGDLSDSGIVVIGQSVHGLSRGLPQISWADKAGDLRGELRMVGDPSTMQVVSTLDYKNGALHVLQLPAGEYAFTGWYVDLGRSGLGYVEKEGHLDYQFDVLPGQAVYLGTFEMRMEMPARVKDAQIAVTLEDDFYRDRAEFFKRYPKIESLEHQVME